MKGQIALQIPPQKDKRKIKMRKDIKTNKTFTITAIRALDGQIRYKTRTDNLRNYHKRKH